MYRLFENYNRENSAKHIQNYKAPHYRENFLLPSKIQIPNLGKCKETSTWSSVEEEACKRCINRQDGSFYCNGECKKYDTLSYGCSYDSLVAKNMDQCSKPCYQTNLPPSYRGECSDNFDCQQYGDNRICSRQYDPDGQIRGTCVRTEKPDKKPDKKPSKHGKWEIVKPHVAWNINLQAFEWIPEDTKVLLYK